MYKTNLGFIYLVLFIYLFVNYFLIFNRPIENLSQLNIISVMLANLCAVARLVPYNFFKKDCLENTT